MISEYIEYQRNVKNLSERTLKEYEKNLAAFARWARENRPGKGWSQLTKQDIDAHTADMMRSGKAARTARLRVASIRALYNWMITEGAMTENPARYAQSPRPGVQLPQVVDTEIICSYLASEATTRRAVEIQALTALLTETGVRLQEALDIRTWDVDKTERSILIHGKGNKQRKVYYGDVTRDKMNRLAAAAGGGRLFTFDQRAYRIMMSAEFRKYTNYIHPHMLRHTYATRALKTGIALKTVSAMLGHASARTTEIYTHVAGTSIHEAAMAMHM